MMFSSLVMMLGSQAMIAMGKMMNPVTGKIERQMDGAQIIIDMLEMIRERTQGNLTDEETRMLDGTLRDLRINYVAEVNRGVNPSSPAADSPNPPQMEGGVPDNVA
jgi:hypothetical protein